MGRNYVNPTILRTNAILKNKYFRQCLELWNFLEGYDESGYGITVSEVVRDPDDSYIRELYDSAATQYLLFRHHTRGEYADGNILTSFTSEEIHPHINIRIKDAEDALDADSWQNKSPELLENLGITEHLRWCAFHYSMGFVGMPEEVLRARGRRYQAEVAEKGSSRFRITKDLPHRMHACLCSW